MANPNKLVHSFSIALLFLFSLLIFELASARPLDASALHRAGLMNKILSGEEKKGNMFGENSGKHAIKKELVQANYRKLGLAYGPSLMNMLPKGRIPVSGPSRRINDANN